MEWYLVTMTNGWVVSIGASSPEAAMMEATKINGREFGPATAATVNPDQNDGYAKHRSLPV